MTGLLALAAVAAVAAAPLAQIRPMGRVELRGQNGLADQFVYVPAGRTYADTALEADARPTEATELTVRLDDRTVFAREITEAETLRIPLGVLTSGFHRLTLLAVARSLVWQVRGEQRNPCVMATQAAIILDRVRVSYRSKWARPPWISDLPDPLYDRSLMGTSPLVGSVTLTPLSDQAVQAALRLTSAFSAARAIRWQVTGARFALPADFHVILTQDPAQQDPAAVHVRPGRLEITYRGAAGLDIAVNALLDPQLRNQLRVSDATLDRTGTPTWGTLTAPRSLSDLGINDQIMAGRSSVDLALVFPPHWAPIGAPRGDLVLRAEQGLQTGAGVWAWIDGALAGSASLVGRQTGANVHMRVDGPRVPATPSIGLRIEASLPQSADCSIQGVAWLDAHASTIELPHRIKAGIGGLTATLVGRPNLTIQPTPDAVQAAFALVQAVWDTTGGAPVPLVVHFGAVLARADTVFVGVDPAAFPPLHRDRTARLYPGLLTHGTWMHATDETVWVLGADPEALVWFSRHWRTIDRELPDGMRDAIVSADGYVQSLSITSAVQAAEEKRFPVYTQFPVYSPWAPVAVGGILILAVAALARARRRKR